MYFKSRRKSYQTLESIDEYTLIRNGRLFIYADMTDDIIKSSHFHQIFQMSSNDKGRSQVLLR